MRILDGIRVIDGGEFQAGPSCCAMLGDLGAEVIHFEDPKTGDRLRWYRPEGESVELPGGRHALFEEASRNKLSVAVNLKVEAGQRILHDLVKKSDVFVANRQRTALKRLGMDYDTLIKLNPSLIYASLSGWGEKGAEKDLPAYDTAAGARSGLMQSVSVGEEGWPPVKVIVADRITGIFTAYGVMAALLARERFKVSPRVSTSLLGSLISLQGPLLSAQIIPNRELPRGSHKKAPNPMASTYYRCRDGGYAYLVNLVPTGPENSWEAFCRLIGRPEIADDPRFNTLEKMKENAEILIPMIDEAFLARDRDEWISIFREHGFPCSKIGTEMELRSDPQVLENEYIVDYDHPALGLIKTVGFPVKFSDGMEARISRPAPTIGEHTEQVLTEILGYSWEEVTQLKDSGVII